MKGEKTLNKLLVDGHENIEKVFGYWPSFHDKIIDKIEITDGKIILYFKMENPPNGVKSYNGIKLMFCEVEKFSLEGEPYGCASIILDIESRKMDDHIETHISSSLGASGVIHSKKMQIEFV